MGFTPSDPTTVANSWLSGFGNALQAKDAHSAAEYFLHDGWLRESQIFCWDNRTLHPRGRIYQHILEQLPHKNFSKFRIDTREFLAPERGRVGAHHEGILFGFLFETQIQWGQGYAQLVQDQDGVWRALAVYMSATDIKGHEEVGRELGIYADHTVSWPTVFNQRRKEIEEHPHVLIIGASQTGLIIAARFKQMGIPTLAIDAQPRLGDAWRNRYDSLTLHTPRTHDQFLYQCFPQTWPYHTPKDKLANWIEHYADAQDLTVWTDSRPTEDSFPIYDDITKRWTITINRAGQHVTLHPAHIVCCIGLFGTPIMPEVKNRTIFKGTVIHSDDYKFSAPFANKRVVVVGAGNTAADICLDLSSCAESLILVQRSQSTLVPAEVVLKGMSRLFPDDGSVPVEVADFKNITTPNNLTRIQFKAIKAGGGGFSGEYADVYKGLQEKGMIVDDGEDGEGVFFQVLEKLGGFSTSSIISPTQAKTEVLKVLDTGFSKQVLSGRVKVKHGVEVAELKEQSVTFTDGSEAPADVVIFATGYNSVNDSVLKLFGKATAERAGRFWGLDEEGELKNVLRPTGHPALWYGAGAYSLLRYGSKQLAMYIKATALGLRDP